MRLVGGKPMIAYTIEAMLDAPSLVKRWVYSNDPEVIALAEATKGLDLPPFTRPNAVSNHHTSTEATVTQFLEQFLPKDWPSIIIVLQPTSPNRSSQAIEAAITQFIAEGGLDPEPRCDVVLSVCPPPKPMDWLMLQTFPNESLKALSQFVSLPNGATMCYPNGAIYVTRPQWLISGGALSLVGPNDLLICPRVMPYLMPTSQSTDVDTAEDALLAEFWLRRQGDVTNICHNRV
jgi:CMP-N,N'-diacetyllegionaminic acid synthase